jgi:hypothetical protein
VFEQPFPAVTVMVKVVVWLTAVLFTKTPVIELPVPELAIPVKFVVLFLVQVKEVPGKLLALFKLIELMAVLLQIVCVLGVAVKRGLGNTITSVVVLSEAHPLAVAVNVKVTVWLLEVLLFKTPDIEVPVPDPLMPETFTALSLVQLKVVPDIPLALLKTIGVIEFPPHKV